MEDKIEKAKYFWKTILVANTKLKIILKIVFLRFNNADMLFDKKTLI